MEKKYKLFLTVACCLIIVAFTGCANKPVAEDSSKTVKTVLITAKEAPVVAAEYVFTSAHFELDGAVISDGDKEMLKQHADKLKVLVNDKSVTIGGHCDERGSTEYNLALGQRRAEAVEKYLLALGIAKDKVKAISYGKEKPLDPASTEAAWAKNRRAEFIIK